MAMNVNNQNILNQVSQQLEIKLNRELINKESVNSKDFDGILKTLDTMQGTTAKEKDLIKALRSDVESIQSLADKDGATSETLKSLQPHLDDINHLLTEAGLTNPVDLGLARAMEYRMPGGGPVVFGKKEPAHNDPSKTHTYIGAQGSGGKTVYADVTSKDPNGLGKDHDTVLKNEAGKDITPADLKTGQYGVFQYNNGAKYVSMPPSEIKAGNSSGYLMVTDGKAYDMFTNQEVSLDDVDAYLKANKTTIPTITERMVELDRYSESGPLGRNKEGEASESTSNVELHRTKSRKLEG
jgi:hypothetical protein